MRQKENGSAVEKAIQVLLTLAEKPKVWGVRELSRHLNFSAGTAFRILETFSKHNFAQRDPVTRQYSLGSIFYGFVETMEQSRSVTQVAPIIMHALSGQTHESVYLNIIEGDHRLCIYSIDSPEPIKASIPVGHRTPLNIGASSKCLLAFSTDAVMAAQLEILKLGRDGDRPVSKRKLEELKTLLSEIRNNGYAIGIGEAAPGFAGISAPIRDRSGHVVASLTIGMPDTRFAVKKHREYCTKQLLTSARSIEKAMGMVRG